MYFNEFSQLSSCISNLNSFNRVTILKMKPSLVLVSRMAWEICKPEQHVGSRLQNTEWGYFESGMRTQSNFQSWDFAFYRYGPNQLPKLRIT
jgi:hypothetical protein